MLACLCATGPWWGWIGILPALGLGILGKESAIVGFGLVPLVWAYQHLTWWTRTLTALGSLAFVPLGAWKYGGLPRMVNLFEGPGMTVTWWDWLQIQATAVLRLFTLTILPLGQTVDYDYDRIPKMWQLAALASLIALSVLLWKLTQAQPIIAFGLAWALIAILPRFVIQTPRSYLNEHQAYLSLIGLAIAGAACWDGRVVHG